MSVFVAVHLVAVLTAFFLAWQTRRAVRRGAAMTPGMYQPHPTSPESAAHIDLTREDRARERRARLRAELYVSRAP